MNRDRLLLTAKLRFIVNQSCSYKSVNYETIHNVTLLLAISTSLFGTEAAKADTYTVEFEDALDFIYQISDGFVYDEDTGMKAGIIGWTDLVNSQEIVLSPSLNLLALLVILDCLPTAILA